jgi:hypothetical protein
LIFSISACKLPVVITFVVIYDDDDFVVNKRYRVVSSLTGLSHEMDFASDMVTVVFGLKRVGGPFFLGDPMIK